jgi:hypothetical protein
MTGETERTAACKVGVKGAQGQRGRQTLDSGGWNRVAGEQLRKRDLAGVCDSVCAVERETKMGCECRSRRQVWGVWLSSWMVGIEDGGGNGR